MGKKRTGTRQHLYLCLTCLIVLGCTTYVAPRPEAQPEVQQKPVPWLQAMQPLIDRGEYEKAVRKSEELLVSHDEETLPDEALFALALLSADVKNPRKDYRKSRDYFVRLAREYPGSVFAGQARIWIGVLDLFEKSKQVDLEIDVKKKEIGK
jgi:hypothetical protein